MHEDARRLATFCVYEQIHMQGKHRFRVLNRPKELQVVVADDFSIGIDWLKCLPSAGVLRMEFGKRKACDFIFFAEPAFEKLYNKFCIQLVNISLLEQSKKKRKKQEVATKI